MRKAIIICVLAAALSACGSVDDSSDSKASRIDSIAAGSAVNAPVASVVVDDGSEDQYERDVQTYYSSLGEQFEVELSRYSNDAQVMINYIEHGGGFLPEMNGSHRFIIRTEEEFEYVKQRYGLPPIDTEFYTGGCEGEFIECGFDEFDYVIEYDEHSTGGYDLRPAALVVDTDKLEFVFTSDSKVPGDTEMVTEAFTGDIYIAALPKGTLMNDSYEGWEYIDLTNSEMPVDGVTGSNVPIETQLKIQTDTDKYMTEGELIATIEDGSGEVMRQTEVYKLDDDWCYVNFNCKTSSWGSSEWERNIVVSGRVHTIDAVIKAAQDFGSDGYVIYPSDKDTHTLDAFIEKWS
ncbi:MAG: hypothetical protein IJ571_07205 [Ruminococcus sp.]|nr:hypothetical protein [Ruminococcus sp.]